MSLQDIEVGTDSSRHDDVEVVLAASPAGGTGVDAGLGPLGTYGGCKTPAGEYRTVAMSDREHSTRMVRINDAARSDRQGSGRCRRDTAAGPGHDGVVQYSESHFFLRGEERTTKALAGQLREWELALTSSDD